VVAFVATTVSVAVFPLTTDVGLAVMLTVGFGPARTVTVACAVMLPPAPVAVAWYVVVDFGVTACVPPAPGRV
jgi:hypothetical protein